MTTTKNSGPPPRTLQDAELEKLLAGSVMGALATNKRSGHPHLSTVAYQWDPAERVIRIGTTADRIKVKQLRTNPKTSLYVSSPDFLSFVVAEGEAELSDVTTVPGDAAGQEILAMQPPMADPAEFLEIMVAERRLVIRLHVSRLYGTALDIPG
ncbi:pyridoxamine 5'-phosphate oxidase family protein [Amycolatopsis sp. H20-H5]|uniref:pyridoxamine 5'-phosphate oxidase family protein n=1 Tax=Amycolatopsis sp. H20-H5 TaxID=3046309 RepID=UPI002DB6E338|nr:pyridoxamine 5'-phosphate oxidase family protein [Amycolatopsis sp. H20-H5]MEC3979867.1 pyridoxamine 5'-phosphate oxidase family protein [Amycolatopsis sp. H20-H5]